MTAVRAAGISLGALFVLAAPAAPQRAAILPTALPRMATVDERYQSYNIEMVEVTGGQFWRPYDRQREAGADARGGRRPPLFQYRPPIDLTNARLRKLAAALAPAYVRVSGTWANTTYFPETDRAPATVPRGFTGVLRHDQWKGVIDFAEAVDARIVTSFATGAGTRDATGVWTTGQAGRFLTYTANAGGRIAAAEFMNEPRLAVMGGAPEGYTAQAYGRDFKIFHAFLKRVAPHIAILGPGSLGETARAGGNAHGSAPVLSTRDLLLASQPARVDGFSYHHYGAVSRRCDATGHEPAEAALSED